MDLSSVLDIENPKIFSGDFQVAGLKPEGGPLPLPLLRPEIACTRTGGVARILARFEFRPKSVEISDSVPSHVSGGPFSGYYLHSILLPSLCS